MLNTHYEILDHGFVKIVQHWGSDEEIIRSARMSTNGAFKGWGTPDVPGDERLLSYLYKNKHFTPFEMAGLTIEVKAPIFVFREWHRHRTQSYNEMSGRYIPIPNEHYLPTFYRIEQKSNGNKQAASIKGDIDVSLEDFTAWVNRLDDLYKESQEVYEFGLNLGIPKELARLSTTVARYSKMRASANLRNWLGFLELRDHSAAQWEMREYAGAVNSIISQLFPRTHKLYLQSKEC